MTMERGEIGGAGDRKAVLHRLRSVVWRMKSPDDMVKALVQVRQALDEVRIRYRTCRLYRVEERGGSHRVRVHDLRPDGYWCEVSTAEAKAAILKSWSRPEGIGCRHLEANGEARALGQGLGFEVRTVLEVAFEQGLLVLYSPEPVAFAGEEMEFAEELQDVLTGLFRRTHDLEILRSKEIQLRQVQRLQMMGQLTAEVAHEINNPLTVVVGEANLLLNDRLEPLIAESVKAIYKAGLQARDISEKLLNFARGQKAEKEWLNFNRLVQETALLVRRTLQKENIEIVEDLTPNLPWVEAHAGQIQQVILNLLQNSRDAVRGRGIRGVVILRTCVRTGWVVLEVEDNGPGIPEEIRHQIFEPFFTTKERGQGTGLGLSVCEGIARDHGGRLSAAPRRAGACLVLELPLRQTAILAPN